MTFKIKKIQKVVRMAINGEPLTIRTDCYVYRSSLFGLIKRYLKVFPDYSHGRGSDYTIEYVPTIKQATFFSEEKAEMLIREIKNNPNKFVIYTYD